MHKKKSNKKGCEDVLNWCKLYVARISYKSAGVVVPQSFGVAEGL